MYLINMILQFQIGPLGGNVTQQREERDAISPKSLSCRSSYSPIRGGGCGWKTY